MLSGLKYLFYKIILSLANLIWYTKINVYWVKISFLQNHLTNLNETMIDCSLDKEIIHQK